jgi:hypothetical protein
MLFREKEIKALEIGRRASEPGAIFSPGNVAIASRKPS